jgi:hypothetical protein
MKTPTKPFVLCVDNTNYQASLILGKVYPILPEPLAAKDDLCVSSMKAVRTTSITKTISCLSISPPV